MSEAKAKADDIQDIQKAEEAAVVVASRLIPKEPPSRQADENQGDESAKEPQDEIISTVPRKDIASLPNRAEHVIPPNAMPSESIIREPTDEEMRAKAMRGMRRRQYTGEPQDGPKLPKYPPNTVLHIYDYVNQFKQFQLLKDNLEEPSIYDDWLHRQFESKMRAIQQAITERARLLANIVEPFDKTLVIYIEKEVDVRSEDGRIKREMIRTLDEQATVDRIVASLPPPKEVKQITVINSAGKKV